MVTSDDTGVQDLIFKWYDRAQIDYSDLYVRLYISYNAWFRQVTHTEFDREAIARLTKRFIIWDDYINGRILRDLKPLVIEISTFTRNQPLTSGRWDGIVHNVDDWRGLIQFWYQIRCDLFHGAMKVGDERVRLAYLSLSIFMSEITERMKRCFTAEDYVRLEEIQLILRTTPENAEQFHVLQEILHQKFISSPSVWNVDMVRV